MAKITALDAIIEWYTREEYQVLNASRWGSLKRKIAEHRKELTNLLQSIGIDENRPQDEAWGWVIRLNEQIRKEWLNCDQNDPLAKRKVMEGIDEMNEKRWLELEAISKEDCRVNLLGWVSIKDRKPLPDEAISKVEPSSQQQTTEHASSQQACHPSAPISITDVAMTEGTDTSTQFNGDDEQATLTAAEDAAVGVQIDATNGDASLFDNGLDFCDEFRDFAAALEANNASEHFLEPVSAYLQDLNQVAELPNSPLPSTQVMIATEPQVIAVDGNTVDFHAEALSTVPTVDQGLSSLGSVPTFFKDDIGATQSPQLAKVVVTGHSDLTEAEEAFFEELIDVSAFEQDVQQDQVPIQQEPMLAPVEDVIYQTTPVPQGVPFIVDQDNAVTSQTTEVLRIHGAFKSSAEWNERPDIPTLDEFLQFMDESTKRQIRAHGWSKIQEFVQLDTIHPAQLDVFAFAPPEVQGPMLAEYEKCHQDGGQFILPLLQSHCNDAEYSARAPMCVCFSSFVVQMYPATETESDEVVDEQAQPTVQDTIKTSGLFDLGSFNFGTSECPGPIDLEDIVNEFADSNGDQSTSPIEDVQDTIEGVHDTIAESMTSDISSQSSQHQDYLQALAPIIVDKPAQEINGATTEEVARGKKSAPAKAKRKTATPKKTIAPRRKGPDLPLQPPVDETIFVQLAKGDVVEHPSIPAQEVGNRLGEWASPWCHRSWSEEDPVPMDRTPAELARLQQLGMSYNRGTYAGPLIPSPNASASLVGAIKDHVSRAVPNGANAHASTGFPARVEQQTLAKPTKRSHPGRPAAPVDLLKKTRTRKLKHPESPQKAPSGKYTRRTSKSPGSDKSDSSVSPQQPENVSGQAMVYYGAAPNRRLGLDTSPEDWVAQSTNKRKRAQPAKGTPRKAQKIQQSTNAPLQLIQADDASILNGNGRYRTILPSPAPAQAMHNGMQAPDLVADSPEYSHASMNAPEPMMLAYSSPAPQQVAEPSMGPLTGMPRNVPAQPSQQSFQQTSEGNVMQQQVFQREISSITGMGVIRGMQGSATGMHSTLKQGMQQSGSQGMEKAGLDDTVDSDDDSDDEVMRRLRKMERKVKRQKEALLRIAEMEEEMRRNELALAGR